MSSRNMATIRSIAESSSDPRKALLSAIGKCDHLVLHSQVLVGTYIRPAKTAGGIYMTDNTLQEDEFQGTIGLVLALGPGAFKDDGIAKFHGVKVKIGDWVLYRPADGLALEIRKVPCRIFEDVNIKMLVTDPQLYW